MPVKAATPRLATTDFLTSKRHATTGNTRSLDSMVRAANSRSHATLAAIRALV